MFIVTSYPLAVIFCVVTMLCWGSWVNTQKKASQTWRYELYYWDYLLGVLLLALVMGLTMGSIGDKGAHFIPNLLQLSPQTALSAFLAGVVFNVGGILLSASTAVSAISVAFPICVGLALAIGCVNNYMLLPKGDPLLLFGGVALVVTSVMLSGFASSHIQRNKGIDIRKGILAATASGIVMAFFYRFGAAAIDFENLESPADGKATPYTATFLLATGKLCSNFIFGTYLMKRPIKGQPLSYKDYFKGPWKIHLWGLLGGAMWGLATLFNYLASGSAGVTIAYSLGQGGPMIATLWGVFCWKEFKGTGKAAFFLLAFMLVFFLIGWGFIVASGV